MLTLFLSIVPVFLVIALGVVARRLGLLPPVFIRHAARLALNLAIPALIFRVVYHVPPSMAYPWAALITVIGSISLVWGLSVLAGKSRLFDGQSSGYKATFHQGTIQCNLGFMGLATVYYSQGDAGLALASLITPGMFTFQTMLSALTLAHGGNRETSFARTFGKMLVNPIILAPLLGLAANLAGLAIPDFIDRTLQVVAGLGLPLALLIIGATLDLKKVAGHLGRLSLLALAKLALLPLLALVSLLLLGADRLTVTVAVLLLGQPVAAIAVIMAGDLGGDMDFAAASVSLTTALSPLTLTIWLFAASLAV